jgi:mycothiol S-conjugate amidase
MLPEDVIRDVHPYEEFELAHSRVPADVPEDSMFGGLATADG